MISAATNDTTPQGNLGFSAIARSVMISAVAAASEMRLRAERFSAIARSVMISAANKLFLIKKFMRSFSAIARSVMISATKTLNTRATPMRFQCYSS